MLKDVVTLASIASITFLSYFIIKDTNLNSGDTLAGILSLLTILKSIINRED